MLELVDDLERPGHVERNPDPNDPRAKLVTMTDTGRAAMRVAHGVIADIEADYAKALGAARFEEFAGTFDALLDHIAGS
jgi:DNA-binding MarR family transcriptional regulator